MTTENQVRLPFENCFKKFGQSFNRIKYFSCVSDNLDISMLPQEWKIINEPAFDYSFPEPPDKQYIVDGYKHFIQRYLVRDCIESFAVCLDELFFVLMLNGKKVMSDKTLLDALSAQEKVILESFQKDGLFAKIEKLENLFCLKLPTRKKRIVTSLKDIRNCFAHANGVVRPIDGKKDGRRKRKFCWTAFSFFTEGVSTGERRPIEVGKQFEEEVNVCMQIKESCKSLNIGETLSFSSVEIFEIGLSLSLIIDELRTLVATNIIPLLSAHDEDSG